MGVWKMSDEDAAAYLTVYKVIIQKLEIYRPFPKGKDKSMTWVISKFD